VKNRPSCIKHFSELPGLTKNYYVESEETFGTTASFSKDLALKKLGIHHHTLPPGTRTSWPHAERDEEEFVYVLEGNPDVWLDGELYHLSPGDAVGWPVATGQSHTVMNNSTENVRLLVVGEASTPEGGVYYPLNPSRKERIGNNWWTPDPLPKLGPHDGRPKKPSTEK
jgi:uncharacterized cupin superfamily protein